MILQVLHVYLLHTHSLHLLHAAARPCAAAAVHEPRTYCSLALSHTGTACHKPAAVCPGLLAILLWVDTGNTAKQLDAFNKKNKTNFCMV